MRTFGNLSASTRFTSRTVASSNVPGTSIVIGRPRAMAGVRPAGDIFTWRMEDTETMRPEDGGCW